MSLLNDQARIAAKEVGLVLVRFQEGFYVFDGDDGEQLGDLESLHKPWTATDVLGFCGSLEKGSATGIYTTKGF